MAAGDACAAADAGDAFDAGDASELVMPARAKADKQTCQPLRRHAYLGEPAKSRGRVSRLPMLADVAIGPLEKVAAPHSPLPQAPAHKLFPVGAMWL